MTKIQKYVRKSSYSRCCSFASSSTITLFKDLSMRSNSTRPTSCNFAV